MCNPRLGSEGGPRVLISVFGMYPRGQCPPSSHSPRRSAVTASGTTSGVSLCPGVACGEKPRIGWSSSVASAARIHPFGNIRSLPARPILVVCPTLLLAKYLGVAIFSPVFSTSHFRLFVYNLDHEAKLETAVEGCSTQRTALESWLPKQLNPSVAWADDRPGSSHGYFTWRGIRILRTESMGFRQNHHAAGECNTAR